MTGRNFNMLPVKRMLIHSLLVLLILAGCTINGPDDPRVPPVGDYLPLSIGNSWTYEYQFFDQAGGIHWTHLQAISRWTIIDSLTFGEYTEYHVHRIDSGTVKISRSPFGEQPESPVADTSLFSVIEDRNHFTSIFPSPGLKWELQRFDYPSLGDTITHSSGTESNPNIQKYIRNLGLVHAYQYTGGSNLYTTYTYQLIDHSVSTPFLRNHKR